MTPSPLRPRTSASLRARRAKASYAEALAVIATWRLAFARQLRLMAGRLPRRQVAQLAVRPGGRLVVTPVPETWVSPWEPLVDLAERAEVRLRADARRAVLALESMAASLRGGMRLDDPAQSWLVAGALASAAVVTVLGVAATQVAPSPTGTGILAHGAVERLGAGSVPSVVAAGAATKGPAAEASDPGAEPARSVVAPVEGAAPRDAQAAPAAVLPTDRGALPLGKGMWLYEPEKIEGGNVDQLVAKAVSVGLTHVYVRTGSSRMGFYAAPYLDQLLPKAHAAGIRVYGWDFPYLDDPGADVDRVIAAITHTAPGGHRLDGFAPDIETPSEGTNLTGATAQAFSEGLRARVGPDYPLIAVVPRPSEKMQHRFPYHAVVGPYDAIAPMTYWLNRQPDTDVASDVTWLSQFGKPVMPIGQAYDGAPEGGRPGPPPPDEIQRFLSSAEAHGAVGASFWSWQHANEPIWIAIKDAVEFRWEAKAPEALRPGQVRALQAQLTKLGFPVAATGIFDGATEEALRGYQRKAKLEPTGRLDKATVSFLLAPFSPPVGGA